MKHKFKTLFSVLCAGILLWATLAADLNWIPTAKAESTQVYVTYNGPCYYGQAVAGDFAIDGKQVFCIQHTLSSPSGLLTVTEVTADSSNKTTKTANGTYADVLKVLYYGYNGPAQWSGFRSYTRAQSIVVTSYALSHIYQGSRLSPCAADFYEYVTSQPAVPTNVSFSVKQGTTVVNGASVSVKETNGIQKTATYTYAPNDSLLTAAMSVPVGLTAYVNGKTVAGGSSVTLSGGDTFYFQTTSPITASKTVKITTASGINATIYDTGTVYQNLISPKVMSSGTAITFNFTKTTLGTMTFTKKSAADGSGLSGAIYQVYYNKSAKPNISLSSSKGSGDYFVNAITTSNSQLVATFTTNRSGTGVPTIETAGTNLGISKSGNALTKLPLGYYTVVEKQSPEGYNISSSQYCKLITESNASATVKVSATDSKSSVSIEKVAINAEFSDCESYSMNGAEYDVYAVKNSANAGSIMGRVTGNNYTEKVLNEDGAVDVSKIFLPGDGSEKIATFTMDDEGVGHVTSLVDTGVFAAAYSEWNSDTTKTVINNLPAGYTYFVVETKLPDGGGYAWDTEIHYQTDGNAFQSSEPVLGDPLHIVINKVDGDGSVIDADKTGISLNGTVFKFSYYGTIYDSETAFNTDTEKEAERVWYIETAYADGKYRVSLTSSYLAKDYSSDAFYYAENGTVMIPVGTITVEEVKAAEGYLLDSGSLTDTAGNTYDNLFIGVVKKNGTDGTILTNLNGTRAGTLSVTNEVIFSKENDESRGDFLFKKVAYDTEEPMKNIKFTVTLLDTNGEDLETHTIYTGEDGTYASAEDDTLWFYGTGDESKWDPSLIDTAKGALINGTYKIREYKTDANTGYRLVKTATFTIDSNEAVVDLGTFVDIPNPKLHTLEWDQDTESHFSKADDEVTVVDSVTYEYLTGETNYVVKGILMEVKDDGSVTPLLDKNGNIIVSHQVFTTDKTEVADTAMGVTDVTFQFESTDMAGKTFVIYEYLEQLAEEYEEDSITDLTIVDGRIDTSSTLKDDEGNLIAHEDPTDTEQIGQFVKLKTNAVSGETGTKTVPSVGTVTIVDTVTYENLMVGKTYTVQGVLMDKETGKEVLDAEGNTITAAATFKAAKKNGTVDLIYTLDGSLLAGKETVVFEDMYVDGKKIASHADLTDENQTVQSPKMSTTATGANGEKKLTSGLITIVDTVSYEHVEPGQQYVIHGILYNKKTGEPFQYGNTELTATVPFTADAAKGAVDVLFSFDSTGLLSAGDNLKLVVFERIYDAKGILISGHEDLEDTNQTVELTQPEEELPPSPKTGDSLSLWMLLGVGGMALLGTGLAVRARRKAY